MSIPTTHGAVAVKDTGGSAPAVVFIHGNSSAKEIFAAQLDSPLRELYRLLARDLPGHGDSADALDPQRTYTVPGYASVVREVLDNLGIARYVVVGWSLGGHIAIELAAAERRPLGLLITGTPPLGKSLESIGQAFLPTPHMQLTGQPAFTDDEALSYARATTTPEVTREDFRYRAARRTDGRARAHMVAGFAQGLGADQRRTVEQVPLPLAIINGENDPFVNPDYFSQLRYANLWRGQVHRLAGAGHAPFFAQPAAYNSLLQAFVTDCLANAATR